MKSPDYREREAFTLVELLAVILIILILAGLIYAGLQKMKEYAERAKCASNLRGIGTGIALYTADNSGFLPPGDTDGAGNFIRVLEPYTAPMIYFPPAVGSTMASDMFYCPANVRLGCPPAGGFSSPAPHYKGFGGYMINYVINSSVFAIGKDLSRVPASSVRQPTKTVALLDMQTRAPGINSPPTSALQKSSYFDPDNSSFALGILHGSAGNVLFVDGHVESFGRFKMPVASLPSQTTTWWP